MQSQPLTGQKPPRPRWGETTRRTVAIILLIAGVLIAYEARIVFVPLIIGAIVAYLLYPVARLITRITRLPHTWATLLVYVIALSLLVPGGILLAPFISGQIDTLRAELITLFSHPETIGGGTIIIMPGVELNMQTVVSELSSAGQGLIRAALPGSINLLFDASKTFLLVIFTVFISFYLTADADKFIRSAFGLVPRAYRADMSALGSEINLIWAAFFRGQAVLAVVVTVIITALCFAIGMPQPIVLGVLAGLLEFTVSVGHTIWLVVALVVALAGGSTWLPVSNVAFALIVIGTNLVFTKFDLNILIPAIVGSRVRLHPMIVLIGIIVGASIGGVLGIALAAPVIASLRVIGRYIYGQLVDEEPEEVALAAPAAEPAAVVASTPIRRVRKRGEVAG